MAIRLSGFKGQFPHITPRLLDPSAAIECIDAILEDGTIKPIRGTTAVHTFGSDMASFVQFGGSWIGFAADTYAVPGPVAADRLYIADGVKPKMKVGATTYDLALPPPLNPATTETLGTLNPDLIESVTYVYTWVTGFAEESAPSPTSYLIDWSPGLTVRLTAMDAAPAGRNITLRRIYRSQTSASGVTDFYFVAELPAATLTYDHDLDLAPIQNVLPTAEYDEPANGLTGIIALPNGGMAGFRGKELMFAEPYRPHAWPTKYRRTVDYEIVALVAFGSSVAILTKGTPYMGQGRSPADFVIEKMESGLPCVSARGVVDLGYAAAYPSNDGLVTISPQGAQIATAGLFTRKQWRSMNPSSFAAAQSEGRYVFSHQVGASRAMGIIDLTMEAPFFTRTSDVAGQMIYDQTDAEVYILTGLRVVNRWNDVAASVRTATWRSKVFNLVSPESFGAAQIDIDPPLGAAAIGVPAADAAPVLSLACRVFANETLVTTITEANRPVRMPGQNLAERWIVEIVTNTPVVGFAMAGTIEGLGTG